MRVCAFVFLSWATPLNTTFSSSIRFPINFIFLHLNKVPWCNISHFIVCIPVDRHADWIRTESEHSCLVPGFSSNSLSFPHFLWCWHGCTVCSLDYVEIHSFCTWSMQETLFSPQMEQFIHFFLEPIVVDHGPETNFLLQCGNSFMKSV